VQSTQLLLPIALIALLYFMMIRPQQKRAKDQQSMIANIKPGDEIITIGGIYATVVSVGDRIRVAVADGSELELATMAIGRVLPVEASVPDEEPQAEPEAEEDTEEGKQP